MLAVEGPNSDEGPDTLETGTLYTIIPLRCKHKNGQFVLLRYDKCSPLKSACRICKKSVKKRVKNTGKNIGAEIREHSSHHFQRVKG
jgi:hypothetical protein